MESPPNSQDAPPIHYASPHTSTPPQPTILSRFFCALLCLAGAMFFLPFAFIVTDASSRQTSRQLLSAFPPIVLAGVWLILMILGLAWLHSSRAFRGQHPAWTVLTAGQLIYYAGVALHYAASVKWYFGHIELFVMLFAIIIAFVGIVITLIALFSASSRKR